MRFDGEVGTLMVEDFGEHTHDARDRAHPLGFALCNGQQL